MSRGGARTTERGSAAVAPTLEGLVASKEILVVCGSGGVGKTTVGAAIATTAAVRLGGRVLVLTIDPARRLADALGLAKGKGGVGGHGGAQGLGNTERRVPGDALRRAAGAPPRGELWAAMLDTRQSWDDLVRRHAPDRRTHDAILSNPLYQNVAGRFVQSHHYIAMERLFELHAEGKYDLIVVDTPPTRNAVDFLDAPARMADFFSSRLLRWLTAPYRSRFVNAASRPFSLVAGRVLGTQFLADVAEFFLLFQSMYAGFVERADSVKRLLSDGRTSFVVVSTLESAPVREAEYFGTALVSRGLHLGAVVFNKVMPAYLRDPQALELAARLRESAAEVAEDVSSALGGGYDRPMVARVLGEVAESFSNFGVVARREAEQRAAFRATPEVMVTAPFMEDDVTDVRGLLGLGDAVWS